ncbi:helix-turn-helix domain-containing protein [Nonomuraea sp. SBT364]|uniref:helix-turn-helix domain-containing protein n=1 Tax=Nonomuraea sp. SBT364 TaxID=1580530 RepID=UPI00066CD3C3|nr:helix-turn-helix domain-containing protein [Nonomuraea sp. SBT364]
MVADFLVDGARIMARRRSRGLTRRILADLVGCSEEWLRLVENGVKPLDRLSTIMRIAEVLRVEDLSELVGGRTKLPLACDHGESDEVGNALLLPGRFTGEATESVPQVRHQVMAAWEIWQRSPRRYTETRRRLPPLLSMADLSARVATGADREAGTAGLTQVYRLFAALLRSCGQHALALVAADRAVASSAGSAITQAEVAGVLVSLGRYADAHWLCQAVIGDRPESLEVTGLCYLTAALAAAEESDVLRTEELLNHARKIGDRLGPEFALEVDLHRVAVAVRMGRYAQAIRLAAGVDADRLPDKDRQARHLLAVATAYAMDGDSSAAMALLWRIVEGCPEELRFNADAGPVLARLRAMDCESTRGELREMTRITA